MNKESNKEIVPLPPRYLFITVNSVRCINGKTVRAYAYQKYNALYNPYTTFNNSLQSYTILCKGKGNYGR
uniref:Uncharacterized protein n=1 Tax=viral metagenome TaxID=1070528 RepID=A0A6M3J795_9ZZZZ